MKFDSDVLKFLCGVGDMPEQGKPKIPVWVDEKEERRRRELINERLFELERRVGFLWVVSIILGMFGFLAFVGASYLVYVI